VSLGNPPKVVTLLADPYDMSIHPFRRRRPATGRPRIVSVSDHWRLAGADAGRQVVVELPGGQRVVHYLPDEHPALVRFIARAAVAA
jgi:hypothetical protein